MDYYFKLAITFFCFIVFIVSASSQCSLVRCGQYGPYIQSPFWITRLPPESCGHLSFSLSCYGANRTILNLPHSGEFNVERIYYDLNIIALTDPNNCIAQKLLTLNLSTTPFETGFIYKNFTIFNCSRINVDSEYKAYVISCLSGSNYSVIATPSSYETRHFLTTCMVIKQVKFPFSFYFRANTLGDVLFLSWDDRPYCPGCQGRCSYKNTSTLETTCIYTPTPTKGSKNPANKKQTIITVIVICAIFATVFVVVCGPVLYIVCEARRMVAELAMVDTASSTGVVTATSGLCMNTLNSYTIVTIGESCHLPNPEDDTCTICMSKYKPKDTIKSIPECSHYFHVDCIDEWLRRNATCPICRTSPLPNIS